ncbi:type II 3-dehydroquinate dehydratase [Rhodoplanes sp. Z2-YC6860]|uniref:type II 3-dehydroquinate dehydratase n=1 Tax=Rhodoplanes sp. Z2-YC6860 TaxID=674703 RepID=UPI00078C2200|nr:type II 3-dehydroquinate dehydratase [Rhodoplanes sp. Z2-YC6860]AMN42808.1 3-dehydroquinate dehydratase [Rhodoplanes sp. Z2-YC6860]
MAKNATKHAAKTIYVLNGPNLNLLGTREPEIYGRSNLRDVEKLCVKAAEAHGFAIDFRQSNHEGDIVDWIQEAGANNILGVVLNPGGLTHTSVSVHDAIKGIKVPVIETHISNIHAREPWRNHSYVSFAAKAVICGFGINGYALAIDGLAELAGKARR